MGRINSSTALDVQLNGRKMTEKIINNKNFLNKTRNYINKNLRFIIIFMSVCFIIFISFQLLNLYKTKKIQNNSILFFNSQNLDDVDVIQNSMLELSKQNKFYAVLSKLELIEISLNRKNYENAISLYNELLINKDLSQIFISAIASKASYKFIDISFIDSSQLFYNTIKTFISFIDSELINYQGIRLELNYLLKILEVKDNNIEYKNFSEAIDLYNNIMKSDKVSSAIKERVNKIHEFQLYN